MIWVIVAAVAVVGVIIAVVVVRRSRPVDGVAVFQRQIDALSPEARRPVVEKVEQVSQLDDDAVGESDSAGAERESLDAPDSPPDADRPDDQPPEDPRRGP